MNASGTGTFSLGHVAPPPLLYNPPRSTGRSAQVPDEPIEERVERLASGYKAAEERRKQAEAQLYGTVDARTSAINAPNTDDLHGEQVVTATSLRSTP